MSRLFPVFALLLATMFVSLGTGLFNTVVSLRIADEGYLSSMVGLVMCCYFAGQFFACLLIPRLIASVGHVRTYAALAALLSVCAVTFGMFFDITLWAVLRIVAGGCMVGIFMVTESWMNGASSNSNRGLILGLYMTILYCSQAGGQLFLNLAPPDDFKLYSIACILFSLALVPVALSRHAKPQSASHRRFTIRQLIGVSPVGVVCCVAGGLITGAFYGLGPVYASQSGLSTAEISIFMGLCIIGALVIQVPIGRLSDLMGRRWMSVIILLATALVSGLLLTTLTDDRMLLFALVTLYGGLSFSIYTLANAHTNDLVSQDDRVPVAANLLLVYSVGAVAGPIISALMMDGLGPDGLFWFSALAALIMAVAVVYSMRVEDRHAQLVCSSVERD